MLHQDNPAHAEIIQANQRLQNLSTHLQILLEEERSYAAREIHDLGQHLAFLKIELDLLQKEIKYESPYYSGKLHSLSKTVKDGIAITRKLMTEFRPGLLDDIGLEAAIEWLAKDFEQRHGIACRFTTQLTHENFSSQVKTTVFRMLQDYLSGIAKQKKCSWVDVLLLEEHQTLIVEIGNDAQETAISAETLLSIKARVMLQQGEVMNKITAANATSLLVHIPWNAAGLHIPAMDHIRPVL